MVQVMSINGISRGTSSWYALSPAADIGDMDTSTCDCPPTVPDDDLGPDYAFYTVFGTTWPGGSSISSQTLRIQVSLMDVDGIQYHVLLEARNAFPLLEESKTYLWHQRSAPGRSLWYEYSSPWIMCLVLAIHCIGSVFLWATMSLTTVDPLTSLCPAALLDEQSSRLYKPPPGGLREARHPILKHSCDHSCLSSSLSSQSSSPL
jgi:hypothetical protein